MSKYECPLTYFSLKEKRSYQLVVHSAGPHGHFGVAFLQLTFHIWILIAPPPQILHSIDMDLRLVLEVHLAEEIV
jgi:hypothetical protein